MQNINPISIERTFSAWLSAICGVRANQPHRLGWLGNDKKIIAILFKHPWDYFPDLTVLRSSWKTVLFSFNIFFFIYGHLLNFALPITYYNSKTTLHETRITKTRINKLKKYERDFKIAVYDVMLAFAFLSHPEFYRCIDSSRIQCIVYNIQYLINFHITNPNRKNKKV